METIDYSTARIDMKELDKTLKKFGSTGWMLICSFVDHFDKGKVVLIFKK